jgi:hypothetical protein
MYTIADKYEEDCYYNFELEDLELLPLCEKHLLPTRELAEQFIEDHLSNSYVVAEVTIYQITKGGIWEYSVEDIWGTYSYWGDDDYDDSEDE